MRWAWLLVFAGCQFSVTLAPESEIPFCDPNEPMLVACYELDGTTRDGTANQLHASMTDVTFIGGMAGLAMQFGATSAADVADSPKFDVAALTIEAWIAPLMLPATGQRAGILDMNGQYGFFVHEAGRLQCTAGGANSLADLEDVTRLGGGKIDLTIGSALDIFGGTGITYAEAVAFHRRSCGQHPERQSRRL